MIRVLVFDLAKKTGWATGEAGKPPRCGSEVLARDTVGDDMGALYSRMRQFMGDMVSTVQPTNIGFEAALNMPGKSQNTATMLFGLCAHVEQLAHELRRPVLKMDVQEVRGYVVGDRRCGKPGAMAHCTAQGWPYPCDNAADALLLADYLLSSLGAGRLATGRPAMEAIPGW